MGMPSRASCLSLLGGGVLLSGCHEMVCKAAGSAQTTCLDSYVESGIVDLEPEENTKRLRGEVNA